MTRQGERAEQFSKEENAEIGGSEISSVVLRRINNGLDLGKNALRRIIYSHDYTLIAMETAALAAIGVATNTLHDPGMIVALLGMQIGVNVELFSRVYRAANAEMIGNHLSFWRFKYKGFNDINLSNGETLKLGDEVAVLDFIQNFTKYDSKTEDKMSYARRMYNEMHEDLRMLANACREEDPSIKGVDFFVMTSHLLANKIVETKLGVETFPIKNPVRKAIEVIHEAVITLNANGLYAKWLHGSPLIVKEGVLSRKKLLEVFSDDDYGIVTRQ